MKVTRPIKGLHLFLPSELEISQKKYTYLDDSTDYSAINKEFNKIKKEGEYYPVIVEFYGTKGELSFIRYALYTAKRVRRK